MNALEKITVGAATKHDLPAVFSLLQAHDLPCEGLSDHLPTTLVVRAGQRVVGSVALELYGPAALLRSVAVHSTVQGRGLGQRLVRAALLLARERGIDRLYLLTEGAAGYFARFGFRPVPRDIVQPAVRQSVEFTRSCPATAQAMLAELSR